MEKLDVSKNLSKIQEIPSNIEAEQHLLGLLVNNDILMKFLIL